jgi:hypothetical protein
MNKEILFDGKDGKGYQPAEQFPPATEPEESKLSRGDKLRRWIYHQLLFIITIVFIAGSVAGIHGAKIYYENKMGETVQLRGFVHDKNVYEVKVRP